MKIEVVNYVKRRYFSTSSLSDAFKLYCGMTGNDVEIGWTFDFWCQELFSGKEFHVVNSLDSLILSQYLVMRNDEDDRFQAYYQMTFDDE